MTENYNFLCRKYEPRGDGTVSRYILEVTNKVSGIMEEISVTPEELVSLRAMKRILVGRNMFYYATKAEHEKILLELFPSPPCPI